MSKLNFTPQIYDLNSDFYQYFRNRLGSKKGLKSVANILCKSYGHHEGVLTYYIDKMNHEYVHNNFQGQKTACKTIFPCQNDLNVIF